MLPDPRWRPYAATALLLAAAAALNLATGNQLWFGYTLFGAGILCVGVGLARLKGWFLPARPAWLLGLMAALHYGGGSLAGLHQVGGPNGLYYALPWWDNAVHLVGSAALGLGAGLWTTRILPARRVAAVVLAACVAATAGVVVELYEFAQFVLFGTVDQGYYTNTLVDLYNNLLGGVLGAWLAARAPIRSPVGQAAPA
ncbi:MAG: hypothetical protein QOD77_1732 [Thermoplasmata archaeon]|nr:hypothetical protein [Thermoplasmata archaeon]